MELEITLLFFLENLLYCLCTLLYFTASTQSMWWVLTHCFGFLSVVVTVAIFTTFTIFDWQMENENWKIRIFFLISCVILFFIYFYFLDFFSQFLLFVSSQGRWYWNKCDSSKYSFIFHFCRQFPRLPFLFFSVLDHLKICSITSIFIRVKKSYKFTL